MVLVNYRMGFVSNKKYFNSEIDTFSESVMQQNIEIF